MFMYIFQFAGHHETEREKYPPHLDPDIHLTKIPKKESTPLQIDVMSCPSSPASDIQHLPTGVPCRRVTAEHTNSTSSTLNNNINKYNEQLHDEDESTNTRKEHPSQPTNEIEDEAPDHSSGKYSDYSLLRKLFPHHDKTVLLDALLSCDGSTVAAIQYLLTHSIGGPGKCVTSFPHNFSRLNSPFCSNITSSNFKMRKSLKDDFSLAPSKLNLKKETLMRNSPEVLGTPPLTHNMHRAGRHENINDLGSSAVQHRSSPPHPPVPPMHTNMNFPAVKFSPYAAAAQAQQFYTQAHQRYIAAAAAAASALQQQQQQQQHGTTGNHITNVQNALNLSSNFNAGAAAAGFFPGSFLNRPDFAQYFNNAAIAQHHHSSSHGGRLNSTLGIASPTSSVPTELSTSPGGSNIIFNQPPTIPPLLLQAHNSGNCE